MIPDVYNAHAAFGRTRVAGCVQVVEISSAVNNLSNAHAQSTELRSLCVPNDKKWGGITLLVFSKDRVADVTLEGVGLTPIQHQGFCRVGGCKFG